MSQAAVKKYVGIGSRLRRHVEVTDRHTAVDYTHLLKQLSDGWFRNAEKIMLVQDNLSTHEPASLYEALPPAEARRLAQRFEWRYTPKHGSWLNMAETELNVLSSQCLDPRPAHCRQADSDRRGRRMGKSTQQASHQSRLAVHN